MKNREKFNKEIKKAIDENVSGNSTMCNFIRKRVLPNLTNQKVDDTKYDYCRDWSCGICGTAFAFGLTKNTKSRRSRKLTGIKSRLIRLFECVMANMKSGDYGTLVGSLSTTH